MFISTFIKKLKNSIILQTPPQEYDQIIYQQQYNDYQNIEISKTSNLLFSFIFLVQIIILLILISFSLIFKQISSQYCFSFQIFSFLMHFIEIIKKIVVQDNYGDRKLRYLKDTIKKYIYSSDSIIDLSISIAFIIVFSLKDQKNMTNYDNNQFQYHIHQFSKMIIMLKFLSLVNILAHLERLLIQNQYFGQLWQLCKVVILNFVIAHCLSLILIQISQFQSQHNWLVVKDIQDAIWYQKYIWAFYWATTIMLTVGFGDICPVNKHQALCMIFIQTISCIVLAYNINRLGSIISKIHSYDQQKNANIKVFNQISQKTSFSSQLSNKITNYIKQSTLIKRNYNIQQQKSFISQLPSSFKDELLKQMNNKIWKQMVFFQSLSQSLLHDLSKCLQKKLTHPDQTIYTKGQQLNLMIVNNGSYGLCYNKFDSKLNGKSIQTHKIQSNQYRIISLQFLLNQTLPYDIKCVDYAIFYKIPYDKFISSLKNHSFDYEYFFMIKDKDKYLLNQYQIQQCKICKNQKHTLFKCPRLHYFPLKQHIIMKYKISLKKKFINLRSQLFNCNRNIHIKLKPLINKTMIFDNLIKKRLIMYSQNIQYSQTNQDIKSNPISTLTNYQYEDSIKYEFQLTNQQKFFVQCVTTRIKQNLNAGFKQNNHQQPTKVWDLQQCDLANNFKSYFKRHNSNELKNKFSKKTKNNFNNFNNS